MELLRYAALSPDYYPQLFRTFREAFSDYGVDMSYLNERNLRNRMPFYSIAASMASQSTSLFGKRIR